MQDYNSTNNQDVEEVTGSLVQGLKLDQERTSSSGADVSSSLAVVMEDNLNCIQPINSDLNSNLGNEASDIHKQHIPSNLVKRSSLARTETTLNSTGNSSGEASKGSHAHTNNFVPFLEGNTITNNAKELSEEDQANNKEVLSSLSNDSESAARIYGLESHFHEQNSYHEMLQSKPNELPRKAKEQCLSNITTVTNSSKFPVGQYKTSKIYEAAQENYDEQKDNAIGPDSKESSDNSDSGYAGSASSNDAFGTSSPSVSSSDSSCQRSCPGKASKRKAKTRRSKSKETITNQDSCCSSDLADFSSGASDSSLKFSKLVGPLTEDSENSGNEATRTKPTDNAFDTSQNIFQNARNNLRKTPFTATAPRISNIFSRRRRRRHVSKNPGEKAAGLKTTGLSDPEFNDNRGCDLSSLPSNWSFVEKQLQNKMDFEGLLKKKSYEEHCKELNANFQSAVNRISDRNCHGSASSLSSRSDTVFASTPIYDVGVDIMAKILTYLKPTEIYSVLAMPLSKTFRSTFSQPQDLWKVLCLSEPFHATIDRNRSESDDSLSSYPICKNLEMNHFIGRYRLLYASFVKCVRYVDRIQDDAKNGRTPLAVYDSDDSAIHCYDDNASLQSFFAAAHAMKRRDGIYSSEESDSSSKGSIEKNVHNPRKRHKSDETSSEKKVRYSASKLTERLLGPSNGVPGNVDLPQSCAMYSVVNWMTAFTDVFGIQLMCLKVLPDLLVDEHQRTTAQNVKLTDIVLRAMVLFPDMVELHTAAFHTLVLLARPLGGKEGMLFHSAMVNASGIFNVGSSTGKSGIAIMFDSMKRFVDDEDLQAMSCWSMVNIALIPSQKVVLVRLGGINSAANAMIHHPHNAEVQFRALFALINLVIPSETMRSPAEAEVIQEQIVGMNRDSETEMLDESIEQVTNLVVVAMMNFCTSEAILNRACLVLHNLSLNEAYHSVLLLTPNCFQMLQWCKANYRHDTVLQQSVCGSIQRLQMTLSSNRQLREKFDQSIRAQQQLIVENTGTTAEVQAAPPTNHPANPN